MLFVSLLFVLQFFYWFIGRRYSKRVSGQDDYFLAGKSVRLFPLMMTFLATQVGGGVVLGSAEEAYQFGWPVLLYPLGQALGLVLLGLGVGSKLASFKVSTVAEIFEVSYRSKLLRKIAAGLSVISLFMVLVAQIIGSSKFLVALGFSNTPLFIAFWAIVIVYTAQGGLKAVISTDMVQAAFFSIVLLGVLGFVLYQDPISTTIPLPSRMSFANISSKLWGWILMPLLFIIIEQDMGQRCFAGDCPRTVSKASLLAGLSMMVVCVVPVFFGALARTLEIEVPEGGSVLMAVIAKTTNPLMTALVGCAVMAAIISTATSLINAISSNLASDFSASLVARDKSLRLIQIITASLSIGALFFAFFLDNIVDVLIQSYELSVSCLFIPLVFALFKKKGSFLAALTGMLFGAFGFILFRFIEIGFPREVASLILSLLGYGLGFLVAFARSKVLLNEA